MALSELTVRQGAPGLEHRAGQRGQIRGVDKGANIHRCWFNKGNELHTASNDDDLYVAES